MKKGGTRAENRSEVDVLSLPSGWTLVQKKKKDVIYWDKRLECEPRREAESAAERKSMNSVAEFSAAEKIFRCRKIRRRVWTAPEFPLLKFFGSGKHFPLPRAEIFGAEKIAASMTRTILLPVPHRGAFSIRYRGSAARSSVGPKIARTL